MFIRLQAGRCLVSRAYAHRLAVPHLPSSCRLQVLTALKFCSCHHFPALTAPPDSLVSLPTIKYPRPWFVRYRVTVPTRCPFVYRCIPQAVYGAWCNIFDVEQSDMDRPLNACVFKRLYSTHCIRFDPQSPGSRLLAIFSSGLLRSACAQSTLPARLSARPTAKS
jgi:hypothetical protein